LLHWFIKHILSITFSFPGSHENAIVFTVFDRTASSRAAMWFVDLALSKNNDGFPLRHLEASQEARMSSTSGWIPWCQDDSFNQNDWFDFRMPHLISDWITWFQDVFDFWTTAEWVQTDRFMDEGLKIQRIPFTCQFFERGLHGCIFVPQTLRMNPEILKETILQTFWKAQILENMRNRYVSPDFGRAKFINNPWDSMAPFQHHIYMGYCFPGSLEEIWAPLIIILCTDH
jgi:hypothetical protein